MACIVLLAAAFGFLGGAVLGMHKSKLKYRYLFAAIATLTVVLVYFFLPTCAFNANSANMNLYNGPAVRIQQHRPKLLNGRGLLHEKTRTIHQTDRSNHLPFGKRSKAKTVEGDWQENRLFENKHKNDEWVDADDYENDKTDPSVFVDTGKLNEPPSSRDEELLDNGEDDEENKGEEYEEDDDEEDDEDQNDVKVFDVENENGEDANFDEMSLVEMNDSTVPKLPSPQQPDSDQDDDGDKKLRHNKAGDVTNLYSNITLDAEFRRRYLVEFENYDLATHLTPTEAKIKFTGILPWWELGELEHYPRIWFVGAGANKTRYNQSSNWNYGFDYANDPDHEGRYIIVKGDHIEYRYKIIRKLGAGSFGAAVLAEDMAVAPNHSHRKVAIKIMHNDSSVEKYFKKELDIMRHVMKATGTPERYSRILRSFFFRNHLCIVFELLGNVLDEELKTPIKDLQILQKYARDILTSVNLLHRKNIIHGDLKPDNIMFARGCNLSCPIYVKVADFNLACVQNSKKFPCPGRYFQTRHYRAPEVILDLEYDTTADMWSIGVIMAALYMNKVPFYGETTTDQLAAIMEVMGLVPNYMVEESPRIRTYQKAICYVCENGFKRVPYRKNLSSVLEGMPAVLYDFIQKCFVLDYQKRMTSEEALRHPFITGKFKPAVVTQKPRARKKLNAQA